MMKVKLISWTSHDSCSLPPSHADSATGSFSTHHHTGRTSTIPHVRCPSYHLNQYSLDGLGGLCYHLNQYSLDGLGGLRYHLNQSHDHNFSSYIHVIKQVGVDLRVT